jgi:hypothetical protein
MLAFTGKKSRAGSEFNSSAIRRLVAPHSRVERFEPRGSEVRATPAFFDFNRVAIHSGRTGAAQTESLINRAGDRFEQEADTAAHRVMNAPAPVGQKVPNAPRPPLPVAQRSVSEHVPGTRGSLGTPLSSDIRAFMEPRFSFDFSRVRVHTDREAGRLSRGFNAQAFTQNEHIFYGDGRSPGVDALTAHELAHVVQQAGGDPSTPQTAGATEGRDSPPNIQRVLEVRPPGPHDASAFDRRDQLIARLNGQSAAIHYYFDDRLIRYTTIDAAKLTEFDRRMQEFIDQTNTLPMRLTSGADRVGVPGDYRVLTGDSFAEGNVDLDDLLADDDFSFRSDLVHFLTERSSVPNYAKRMGVNLTDAEYHRGHRLGEEAEAAVLREFFHDPSIQFNYDETKPNGTWLHNFVSQEHHYQVFQIVSNIQREIAGGAMFVRTADGKRMSMEDFRAQRDAAGGAK